MSTSEAAAQAAASCTISVGSVAFGSYNVFSAGAVDSAGSISYSCNARSHHILIVLSQGASATFGARTMTKGTESLTYNLFLDAARTAIWGDGTGGTSTYTRNNPPNDTSVRRIPAAQDVSAGTYSDTILATINF